MIILQINRPLKVNKGQNTNQHTHMQAYENGECRITAGLDKTNDSFAVLLMEAIIYYRDFRLHGKEMLITFSDEEEQMIRDESRKLLKNRCSLPNEEDRAHERMLLAKALQAMIWTVPVSFLDTLRLCTYIKSVVGKTGERKIGILYHCFSSFQRDEQGTSFIINDIDMTMCI